MFKNFFQKPLAMTNRCQHRCGKLYNAFASVLALHSKASEAKSITFVSIGTGVYNWPMALAADIAVKALLTSRFEQTLMCVVDEKTRLIYQAALDRYL